MTQVTDEWEAETKLYHSHVDFPFLRIVKVESSSDHYRIYLAKLAYELIGKPEFVQIMMSKSKGEHRLKLVQTHKGITNARPIRVINNHHISMGGGANVHRHGFPHGYYELGDDNVFTWRCT